ncbi:Bifunctional UDP-glucose 4-epimerase and UDP-xylose 4-epimerase 1 [Olea europaea subsp. europaea]|uniref:Bifunctional UDP-glucose 4-epimerase and UDP-xylose 4-epimerase 1 n=1 Tax=Olea europaea subsp. europaea TaxID=158383 RepID=A0A8S0R5F9_OLEEU|nr:Bifunctional UDP-glucose 4-epimerase and UDP-xylose 4-epimerase 1 [Olea europaea subsp. europaea]
MNTWWCIMALSMLLCLTPGGMITGIRYNGIDNLLESGRKENDRGYWDVVWGKPEHPSDIYDKFQFMVVSDERQRIMPARLDRKRGQILDYPEAIILTDPGNSFLRGEFDDKYQYSSDHKDC